MSYEIDPGELESQIAARMAKAIDGRIPLVTRGYISTFSLERLDGANVRDTIFAAIEPFVDILVDDITMALAEPWPLGGNGDERLKVECGEGTLRISFVANNGRELVRLEPIPVSSFIASPMEDLPL